MKNSTIIINKSNNQNSKVNFHFFQFQTKKKSKSGFQVENLDKALIQAVNFAIPTCYKFLRIEPNDYSTR